MPKLVFLASFVVSYRFGISSCLFSYLELAQATRRHALGKLKGSGNVS